MFDRMPPGQAPFGKPSVSSLSVSMKNAQYDLNYILRILTRCSIVATEIRSSVATKAGLRLQVLAHAIVCIAYKHTEALGHVS